MSTILNVADAILDNNRYKDSKLELNAEPEFEDLAQDEEDVDLDKEEEINEYEVGGYHPCKIGDIIGDSKQYKIMRKLGWGYFSTVWLAYNSLTETYVAVKIIKSADKFKYAAIDEIKLLKLVDKGSDSHPGKRHVMKLLDYFLLNGPHGSHICMVFELLGESVLSLINKFRDLHGKYQELSQRAEAHHMNDDDGDGDGDGDVDSESANGSFNDNDYDTNSTNVSFESVSDSFSFGTASGSIHALDKIFKDYYGGLPLSLVKRISKQILLALDYLHRECGLIHTDLKPENILVEIRNVNKVVDLVRKYEQSRRSSTCASSSGGGGGTVSSGSGSGGSGGSGSGYGGNSGNNVAGFGARKSFSGTTNVKKLTINTGYERKNSACSPIVSSKPLPSPILRRSSIYSFCYGESGSLTNVSSRSSETGSASSLFDNFQFAGERVVASEMSKLSISDFEDELEELDENIVVKIADLGNACYVNHHFTTEIQTREYRSPEVILEAPWGCSADIWSAGCVIFELITGTFAFKPENRRSQFDRNSEHLFQMVSMLSDEKHYRQNKACFEFYDRWFFDDNDDFIDRDIADIPESVPKGFKLHKIKNFKQSDFFKVRNNKCGPFIFPYEVYLGSKLGKKYFNNTVSRLNKYQSVRFKSLYRVLVERFCVPRREAKQINDFLMRMLELHPKYRQDAGSLTNHPWLRIRNANGGYYDDGVHLDRPLGEHGTDIEGWYSEVKEKDVLAQYEENNDYDYFGR